MILAVDIGTTSMKMGVFSIDNSKLTLIKQYAQPYKVNIYNNGLFGDIEQQKWIDAFVAGCTKLIEFMHRIEVISFSGTTPGLTAMDKTGNALYPAILMLDQRSKSEAKEIIDVVGEKELLQSTGNMPVAGGCSLAGILWLKENESEVFEKTKMFGHSNTFFGAWLTGNFAIDPSSASLTALYNTVENNLTWNENIANAFGISVKQLPKVIQAYESVGKVSGKLAQKLRLTQHPHVLAGGNDAVLAAYSAGIEKPGEVINVNGTSEITLVCLDRCITSTKYNVRAHVIPGRWLTLHVMNAGGTALDWFRTVYCSEMEPDNFYAKFLPNAVKEWLPKNSSVKYTPFLMGSRYSLQPLKAEFLGITRQTTREEMAAALVRGLYNYQREHIKQISEHIEIKEPVHITGGAVNEILIEAKKQWQWSARYEWQEQSSMRGAAMLGMKFLTK
jgi:xylulokinase